MMEKSYRTRWQRYCQANNLPKTSPYELRHTFVSAVQTLPEGAVKSIIGHSKSMDTFGVYGHAIEGLSDTTTHLVEQVFKEILKPKGCVEK